MDESARACIKTCVEEGKNKLATRSELVSQGFSSQGFEEVYTAILGELGKEEPKQAMPGFLQSTGEVALSTAPRHVRARQSAKNRNVLIFVILAIVCAALLYRVASLAMPLVKKHFQDAPLETTDDTADPTTLTSTDKLLEAKVESTGASANLYVRRMSFVDGVCKDISVVPPVQCTQSPTSYAVFALLSNYTYYCVDGQGSRGIVLKRPENAGSCK